MCPDRVSNLGPLALESGALLNVDGSMVRQTDEKLAFCSFLLP